MNSNLSDFSKNTRAQGLDIATYIHTRFNRQANLACHLWRWDELKDSRYRKVATRQSTGADPVIIAADGRQELPEAPIKWMRSWTRSRRGDQAMALRMVPADKLDGTCRESIRNSLSEELDDRSTDSLFVSHDGVRTAPQKGWPDSVCVIGGLP